jgi:hypothetical protein
MQERYLPDPQRSLRGFWDRNWRACWDRRIRLLMSCCQGALAGAAILSASIDLAYAHAAPSGWLYPNQCCSNRDCRPLHDADVREGPNGYVIGPTGEIVGYKDPRVKNSPDGEFHLCARPGKSPGKAICLFVPPRSF